MKKGIKLSIVSLIIMYITSLGFMVYAEELQKNLIVKTEPLEKDTIVMVILNYNENDKVAVALAESNNYSQELTLPTNEITIESYSVSCPDGDVTPNYNVMGDLNGDEYILSVEKIGNKKPEKIQVGHSYDGSSDKANTEEIEKGEVKFQAEIPEEFIGDIILYFKDSTDSSISFILSYPNYTSIEKVAKGNLVLQDINVRGLDAQYKVTAQDKIKVEDEIDYLVTVEKANSEEVEKQNAGGVAIFQILSLILVIILLVISVYLYKVKKIDGR